MAWRRIRSFVLFGLAFAVSAADTGDGFAPIFNGKNLDGWHLFRPQGSGYLVEDGKIVSPAGGGRNLLYEKEYSNFIFRFEFKLERGANHGIGIRAPMGSGTVSAVGMEIQIFDDDDPKHADLAPHEYHGSLYGVAPAKRGFLKPVGEWNEEEITANGRRISVVLNGTKILDVDLGTITDPAVLRKRPGILRTKGHIGLLGHYTRVEFRNLRVKELP